MSNLSLASEGAAIICATSNDERHPASNVIDGSDRTFWSTTGIFPQEFVISFPSNIEISAVHCNSRYIKHLTILRCEKHLPVQFEEVFTLEMPKSDGVQRESGEISNLMARYVKVRIDSATEEFAAIYQIQIEGKPAQ